MKIIKKILPLFFLLNALTSLEVSLAKELPVVSFATTLDDGVEMDLDGELVGLEIDLVKELGKRVGFTPEFTTYEIFKDTLKSVKNGEKEAGFSMITINKKRSVESFDFSFPYFVSGLSILSVENSEYELFQGVDLIDVFFDVNIWITLLVFGVFIFSISNAIAFASK
jgi:ABC-type amino acid transport substrate-binding protein